MRDPRQNKQSSRSQLQKQPQRAQQQPTLPHPAPLSSFFGTSRPSSLAASSSTTASIATAAPSLSTPQSNSNSSTASTVSKSTTSERPPKIAKTASSRGGHVHSNASSSSRASYTASSSSSSITSSARGTVSTVSSSNVSSSSNRDDDDDDDDFRATPPLRQPSHPYQLPVAAQPLPLPRDHSSSDDECTIIEHRAPKSPSNIIPPQTETSFESAFTSSSMATRRIPKLRLLSTANNSKIYNQASATAAPATHARSTITRSSDKTHQSRHHHHASGNSMATVKSIPINMMQPPAPSSAPASSSSSSSIQPPQARSPRRTMAQQLQPLIPRAIAQFTSRQSKRKKPKRTRSKNTAAHTQSPGPRMLEDDPIDTTATTTVQRPQQQHRPHHTSGSNQSLSLTRTANANRRVSSFTFT